MAISFAWGPCSTCLAVQCFIALALAEQGACNGIGSTAANLPDGTTLNNDGMSCLLQRQTSIAKASSVAELAASAQATEEDEQLTQSGSDAEGVKKHHHHHERMKETENAHAPTTTDEWADYLVDDQQTSTSTAAPGNEAEQPVSEESEGSWFWKLLCWIDFLHWFTPVPADDAVITPNATATEPLNDTGNVSNVTNVSAAKALEALADGENNETEASNKTELNNTNTTKDPHAPLPASLEELEKDNKARHSKASKRHKKKHGSHKSD